MMISEKYSLHDGLQRIQAKQGILLEIEDIFRMPKLEFGINSPKEIKERINEKFAEHGWADKVKIGTSNLTISFLKSKIGVCFQIGNVARTYADVLKLCQLHKRGIIDAGVIIVPHKAESKKMGANYAQYERLANELSQFEDIVAAPILVMAMSN